MDLLFRFVGWLLGLFKSRERAAGAAEQREATNQANAARLERQNAVVNKPVTNDEVQKSLRDGTF